MALTFRSFVHLVAIQIDGQPMGYISRGELHLKKDAPTWLCSVRVRAPFQNNQACQDAITAADPSRQPMLINLNSTSGVML